MMHDIFSLSERRKRKATWLPKVFLRSQGEQGELPMAFTVNGHLPISWDDQKRPLAYVDQGAVGHVSVERTDFEVGRPQLHINRLTVYPSDQIRYATAILLALRVQSHDEGRVLTAKHTSLIPDTRAAWTYLHTQGLAAVTRFGMETDLPPMAALPFSEQATVTPLHREIRGDI